MKLIHLISTAAFCCVSVSVAGQAQAQTVTASAESIASVLRANGYQAEVGKGSDGDPMIRSGAGGSKFTMLFFGCTKGQDCTSVQFYTGYTGTSADVKKVNQWNATKRFGRAYIDKDGDPVIEMDVDLDEGGMSRKLFEDNLAVWSALVGSYKNYVNGG